MENNTDWTKANQRYLMAALKAVQEELETYQAASTDNKHDVAEKPTSSTIKEELEKAVADLPAPSALDTLVATFGLTRFEQTVLLMCAGVELDAQFGKLIQ